MKDFIIHVREPDTQRHFFYKNLKAAALHIENNIEVGERQLHRLKKANLVEQQKKHNPQSPEQPTGYPFFVDGCWVDRIHVLGTKDVLDDNGTIADGHGNEWGNTCPDCGANMQVMRPGDARCENECWLN